MTYRRWLKVIFVYLLAILFVMSAGMGWAIHVMRRPDYPFELGDPSLWVQDKAFTTRNQTCDVLLVGDSTASVGINPSVIAQQTGLSICDIATSRPIFDTVGTYPLDSYLTRNPAPRIILFQFAPEFFYHLKDWNLMPPLQPFTLIFRHGSPKMVLSSIIQHPGPAALVMMVVFKGEILPRSPREAARQNGVFTRTMVTFNETGGRLNFERGPLANCDPEPLPLFGPLDPAWIKELRQKYEARGIRTLIDVAPIPACDPHLSLFQHSLDRLLDNRIQPTPVGLFIEGGRHMTAEGARLNSLVLAGQIETTLHNTAPSQGETP